jgi:MATE family multidrug resistance protein
MWSSSQFFMGIHRPGVVMYSALVSQLVNVIANYVLIFGHFGFPAMGIAGAAWGTVFAEGVGSAVRMAVFLGPRINREFSSRRAMKIDLAKMWDLVKIGFPTGIELMVNVALWGVMLSGFVGGFGKESLAATSAALACTQFSVMPVVGIRSALTAAVGKAIGAGRKDLAVRQTDLCLRIALIYMGLVGLVILIFRGPIMRAWAGDSQAAGSGMASIGARILVLAAIYQIFHAARVIYSGALRGAGDTLWLAMISAGGSVFVLGVGGWVAVEFFPSFGAVGPWAAATLSIVVVGLANMWRFKTNKWMEIDLLRNADAVASAGNLQ